MPTPQQIEQARDLIGQSDFLSVEYPYKLKPGETIKTLDDAILFVDSHFEVAESNIQNRWFDIYYDRLMLF